MNLFGSLYPNLMTRSKGELIAEMVEQRILLENLVLSFSGSIGKLREAEHFRHLPRHPEFGPNSQDLPSLQYRRQDSNLYEWQNSRTDYGDMKVPVGARGAPFQQRTSPQPRQGEPVRPFIGSMGRSGANLHGVEHTDPVDENAGDTFNVVPDHDQRTSYDDYGVPDSSAMARDPAVRKPPGESGAPGQEKSLALRGVPPPYDLNALPQNDHSADRPALPKETAAPREAEMIPREDAPYDTATFLYELVFGNKANSNIAPGNEMPPLDDRTPNGPRDKAAFKPHEQARETAAEVSRRVTNMLLLKWTSMSKERVMETAEQAAHPPSSAEDREWLKDVLARCAEIRTSEQGNGGTQRPQPYRDVETDDSREYNDGMYDRVNYERRYHSRPRRRSYERRHSYPDPTADPLDARFREPGYVPPGYDQSQHQFHEFRDPYGPSQVDGHERIISTLTFALAEAQTQQRRAMSESGESIKRMIMAVVDRYHGDEIGKFEMLHKLISRNHEEQLKLQEYRLKKEAEEQARRLKAGAEEMAKKIKTQEELRLKEEEETRRAEKERTKSAQIVRIMGARSKHWNWNQDLDFHIVFDESSDRVVNASMIHGTLLWSNPVMPAASEAYETLKAHGWKVLWIRASSEDALLKFTPPVSNYLPAELGETWFIGNKPALVRFYSQKYRPQLGPPSAHAGEPTDEAEWIEVGKEWVAIAAMEMLNIRQSPGSSGRYKLDARLTEVSLPFQNILL